MLSHKHYKSSALFVILINMNQTYMYYSPVYFVYLLASCCNPWIFKLVDCLKSLLRLAAVVLVGFGASLGPFIWMGKIDNLYNFVIPTCGGLVFQSFWAPNIWVFYNVFDIILMVIRKQWSPDYDPFPSPMIEGMNQATFYESVRELNPMLTSLLTCVVLAPILLKVWRCPRQPMVFLHALVLCCLSVFMFGW